MTFSWGSVSPAESPLRRGKTFTTTFPHDDVRSIRCPIVCVVAQTDSEDLEGEEEELFVGVLESKRAATTLEHIVKLAIYPSPLKLNLEELENSIPPRERPHFDRALNELPHHKGLVKLGDATGESVWTQIRNSHDSGNAVKFVESRLVRREHRSRSVGSYLQRSSIDDSLSIFGWGPSRQKVEPKRLNWLGDGDSELRVYEDVAISHDVDEVPGLERVAASQTGVAVFRRNDEELTVVTANKLPLERVFGVDLIYVNEIAEAVVLVQYKVLEESTGKDGEIRWRYQADAQLRKEIDRMELLKNAMRHDSRSFRISDEMHFFKFTKKTSAERAQAGITISKKHFDHLCPTRRGSVVFSVDRGGNYLRHDTFCGLVRSGYVGSRPTTTKRIAQHIDRVLKHGHAVVLATQRKIEAGR